ncbi:hypothetical protein AB1Y20_015305 [Prymnesium parvum]|uniref:Uncharacterized protein n=1 Tax=Prymnesium parvum TaxID=97485 RepID=A0AB34K107_PRYPA
MGGVGRSFTAVVASGLADGLSRAEAEARARNVCFTDSAAVEGSEWEEAAPVESSGGVEKLTFANVDDLWSRLQAAWERRGEGAELTDVLDEINQLLERGVISAEQFAELMLRSRPAAPMRPVAPPPPSVAPSARRHSAARASDAPSSRPRARPPPPRAPPLSRQRAHAAACRVQAVFRGKLGRERFASALRERADAMRKEQRRRAREAEAHGRERQVQPLPSLCLAAASERTPPPRLQRAAALLQSCARRRAAERRRRAAGAIVAAARARGARRLRDEEARRRDEEAEGRAVEARRRAEEARVREEEARVREEEARVREEEARSREEEARSREEEARSREEEARSREEEARSREEEARRSEEEAKRSEEEGRRAEGEARLREEEARRREEEAARGAIAIQSAARGAAARKLVRRQASDKLVAAPRPPLLGSGGSGVEGVAAPTAATDSNHEAAGSGGYEAASVRGGDEATVGSGGTLLAVAPSPSDEGPPVARDLIPTAKTDGGPRRGSPSPDATGSHVDATGSEGQVEACAPRPPGHSGALRALPPPRPQQEALSTPRESRAPAFVCTLHAAQLVGPRKPMSKVHPVLQPIDNPNNISSAGRADGVPGKSLGHLGCVDSAVGSILGAVGGLDSLKEALQLRRESAFKRSKESCVQGPRRKSAPMGATLHWHGSKSFLDQTSSNV